MLVRYQTLARRTTTLAKVGVVSSNLIARSNFFKDFTLGFQAPDKSPVSPSRLEANLAGGTKRGSGSKNRLPYSGRQPPARLPRDPARQQPNARSIGLGFVCRACYASYRRRFLSQDIRLG